MWKGSFYELIEFLWLGDVNQCFRANFEFFRIIKYEYYLKNYQFGLRFHSIIHNQLDQSNSQEIYRSENPNDN